MSKVEIVLNKSGITELLKSQEMQDILSELGGEIADKCGDGYETYTKVKQTRAYASVHTQSFEAIRDNHKNNTLLKGMRG